MQVPGGRWIIAEEFSEHGCPIECRRVEDRVGAEMDYLEQLTATFPHTATKYSEIRWLIFIQIG